MQEKQKHFQKLIHLPRIKQIQVQNELLKAVKKEQQSMLILKNNEQALQQNTQKASKASQQLVQKQNSHKKEQFSFQDYSIKLAAVKEEQEEQKQNKKINNNYFNKEDSNNSLDQILIAPTLSLQSKNSKDYFKVGSIKEIQRYKIQKQADMQESKSKLKAIPDIFKIPLSQIEESPKIKSQNSYFKNTHMRINRPTNIVHDAQQQLYQSFQQNGYLNKSIKEESLMKQSSSVKNLNSSQTIERNPTLHKIKSEKYLKSQNNKQTQ